jgi:hypothetical protein
VLEGTAGRYSEVEIDLFPESAKEVEIFFLNHDVAYEHREPRRNQPDAPEAILVFDWDDIPFKLRIYARRRAPEPPRQPRRTPDGTRACPSSKRSSTKPGRSHPSMSRSTTLALVAAWPRSGRFTTSTPATPTPRRRPPPAQISAPLGKLLALDLPDASGTQQPLSAWKGKVLVVNFWATWCPRAARNPGFLGLSRKYRTKACNSSASASTPPSVARLPAKHRSPTRW